MRSHNVVLWYARSVSAVLISSHCARWVTRANWCTSLYYIHFRNTSGHCARWVTRPLIVSRASPCQHAPAGSLRITIKFFTVKCGFSCYYKYMCSVHSQSVDQCGKVLSTLMSASRRGSLSGWTPSLSHQQPIPFIRIITATTRHNNY